MANKAPKPHDLNQLAASIVSAATGESEPREAPKPKDPAAVALGRKGGKARSDSLSSEQRSEIAKIATKARWKKENP